MNLSEIKFGKMDTWCCRSSRRCRLRRLLLGWDVRGADALAISTTIWSQRQDLKNIFA
jgi:hypothetical protein